MGRERSRPTTSAPELTISSVNTPVPQPASSMVSPTTGARNSIMRSRSHVFISEPRGVWNQRSYRSGQSSKSLFFRAIVFDLSAPGVLFDDPAEPKFIELLRCRDTLLGPAPEFVVAVEKLFHLPYHLPLSGCTIGV